MTRVLKTPGFLLRGMGGRGQGMKFVTPHKPIPFVGGTGGIGDTGGVLLYWVISFYRHGTMQLTRMRTDTT